MSESIEQNSFFDKIPLNRFEVLTKEELIVFIEGQQDLVGQLVKQNRRLEVQLKKEQEQFIEINEQLFLVREKIFGKSSEKVAAPETEVGVDIESSSDPKEEIGSDFSRKPQPKRKRVLLPSQRYPNAPLLEREV